MSGFSQAILTAVRKRKFSDEQIREALSVSNSRWTSIDSGRLELSDREVERIEDLCDRTGGQLALEGSEFEDDLGMSEVMDAWADVRRSIKASDPTPARRRRA